MYSVHSKWSKVIQYFCKKLNVDVSQGPQDLELSIIFKKKVHINLKGSSSSDIKINYNLKLYHISLHNWL